MQVQAKIVSVEVDVTIAKNGGGSYKGTRIAYRDAEGALKEKSLHSNALKFNPALKNQLAEVKAGDDVTFTFEKEGEFWNLKSVSKGVPEPAPAQNGNGASKGANASPRSTYETPEERAQRQVYIVRQSSVSSAIAFAATQKTPLKFDEVMELAKRINAYVFDQDYDDGSLESLPSDNID